MVGVIAERVGVVPSGVLTNPSRGPGSMVNGVPTLSTPHDEGFERESGIPDPGRVTVFDRLSIPDAVFEDAVGRLRSGFETIGIDEHTINITVQAFRELHERKPEAVRAFQSVVDDFKNGVVGPGMQPMYDAATGKNENGSILTDFLMGLNSVGSVAAASYLLLETLRRRKSPLLSRSPFSYLLKPDDPRTKKWLRHYNNRQTISIGFTVLTGLGLACDFVIGTTAPAVGSSTPIIPSPGDGNTPSPDSQTATPMPATPSEEVNPAKTEPPPPPIYSAENLFGFLDNPRSIFEAIDEIGNPSGHEEDFFVKAHRFSLKEMQDISFNVTGRYGIDPNTASSLAENMQYLLDQTAVSVPEGQVYFFSNGLSGDNFRSLLLLASKDGNQLWVSKDSATGQLNLLLDSASGLQEKSFGSWISDGPVPQDADRILTPLDLRNIGGVGNIHVVFQNGTEFAYLGTTSDQVKSGEDVVASVFDARSQQWLDSGLAIPSPTPTETPAPTDTPMPVITPDSELLIKPIYLAVNIASIPSQSINQTGVSILYGGYYYSRSPDINKNTIVERLSTFDGFDGAVIYADVNGRPRTGGNQRAYVTIEHGGYPQQPEGPWAMEESFNVLKAPSNLKNSGWDQDPIAMLVSIGMHVDATHEDTKFRTAGGIRLYYDGGKYYISLYRVNTNRSTTDAEISSPQEVELRVKQSIRLELFYDSNNNNRASIKAFLIKYDDQGNKSYVFIGQTPLANDLTPIKGPITYLGAYVGNPVTDYEIVVGEMKIFR